MVLGRCRILRRKTTWTPALRPWIRVPWRHEVSARAPTRTCFTSDPYTVSSRGLLRVQGDCGTTPCQFRGHDRARVRPLPFLPSGEGSGVRGARDSGLDKNQHP